MLKTRKEKNLCPPTKVVVRRLPPSMDEDEFIEVISPVPENDYFKFVPADKSLAPYAFTRVYINFINIDEVFEFRDKFDSYVFVDKKGDEYPAIVEYAPFQKIPKKPTGRKDARCGTIEQDSDYLAFLDNLQNPEPVQTTALEVLVEEIENRERELRANNGIIKVKTPLLEYIEQRKAEKMRTKEERREERRKKEFERKKSREDEKRRRRDLKDGIKKRDEYYDGRWQEDKNTDRFEDKNKQIGRIDSPKTDFSDNKYDKAKIEKEKVEKARERLQRKEEEMQEKIRLKAKERAKEKDKFRQRYEKVKEERNKYDETPPREKISQDRNVSNEIKPLPSAVVDKSRFEGSKSKRYSEGRRKDEREREKKLRDEKDKNVNETSKEDSSPVDDDNDDDDDNIDSESHNLVENKPSNKIVEDINSATEEKSIDLNEDYKNNDEDNDIMVSSNDNEMQDKSTLVYETKESSPVEDESDNEREGTKSPEGSEDREYDKPQRKKSDPRMERRIRNKDRPAMQIYRPGQSRLSSRLRQSNEDGSRGESSSSSPSPVMSSGDDKTNDKRNTKQVEESQKVKETSNKKLDSSEIEANLSSANLTEKQDSNTETDESKDNLEIITGINETASIETNAEDLRDNTDLNKNDQTEGQELETLNSDLETLSISSDFN